MITDLIGLIGFCHGGPCKHSLSLNFTEQSFTATILVIYFKEAIQNRRWESNYHPGDNALEFSCVLPDRDRPGQDLTSTLIIYLRHAAFTSPAQGNLKFCCALLFLAICTFPLPLCNKLQSVYHNLQKVTHLIDHQEHRDHFPFAAVHTTSYLLYNTCTRLPCFGLP